MKKILPAALVFIAGLILLNKFAKGSAASNLTFNIAGIDFSFAGLVPTMTLSIAVQNTSSQSLTINSMAGSLYINGEYAANVSSFQQLTIPANTEQVYKINLRLSITGVINSVIDIVSGKSSDTANIRFAGTVNFENLQLPVDLTYKLIPEKLLA